MTIRSTAVWLLGFYCCELFGLPSEPSRQEKNLGLVDSDFNTAIRVLLDRPRHAAVVRSAMDSLYAKEGDSAAWFQLEKEAGAGVIYSAGKDPRLSLNGHALNKDFLYLRGGTQPSDLIQYAGNYYRGSLKLAVYRGELMVVNILPLEDYLEGTLPLEMSPSWPFEVLKAQAVASRTYAVYMHAHPKHPMYDMERTVLDQVYGGVTVGSTRALKAIQETAGQVLVSGQRAIKAFFHSRCGGATETPRTVWVKSGKFADQQIPCPFCQQNPFPWKSVVRIEDLLQRFGLSSGPKTAIALEKEIVSPSGRISSLKVTTGEEEKTLSSEEFRNLLGYSRIKSALFEWIIGKGQIRFQGVGAGHGVGLCQWGGRYLARQGQTYRQILHHYYPYAKIEGLAKSAG